MSWNQPGGGNNGNRDPWGERPGQQGPPDLDEVVKKLQAKLAAIFGGKSSGGSNGSGDGDGSSGGSAGGLPFPVGGLGLGIIAVIAFGLWVFAGIFIVEPAEEAVVLRFGKYDRTESPGPHWAPYLIDDVRTVNVQAIESEEIGFRAQNGNKGLVPNEALMLTSDENIVDLQFAVQYRVKSAADFLFQVRDPITTMRQVIESAVREIVGRSKMDFVITEGRDVVAAEVERLAQEILDDYRTGLILLSVNMQNAQPPAQVQDAFIDAIKAREDQERIINEARAFRSDIVPKSRGEADAVRERSEAYRQRVIAQAEGESARFSQVLTEYLKAPEVTRERLYLETVETVMQNASKVMVDVEGGNNLLYLPLDKIIDSARRGTGSRNDDTPNSDQGAARSYDSDSRSRDSRGRAR
jgi:membrane protease subunit HflK